MFHFKTTRIYEDVSISYTTKSITLPEATRILDIVPSEKIILTGISISPSAILSDMLFGLSPLTVHPMEKAVPRISLTVPDNVLDMDLKRMVRAQSIMASNVMFPPCLTIEKGLVVRSSDFGYSFM